MTKRLPQQSAKARIKNFFEVALGFSQKQAEAEARRCLQCKIPLCVKGCPVEIEIPKFIRFIKAGRQRESLEKIKEKNNLPAVCGRVCPQEDQCKAACILNKERVPINIGALERYAADYGLEQRLKTREQRLEHKIAVVGSGPAGLTCAADLAKMGYQVTIFESLHLPGGVLVYGIPEFRLPKKIVQQEIKYIQGLGVEIKTDMLIGNTYTLQDLSDEGYKAIFLAVGAGLPQFLGIPGENLGRVYSANEFLTRINLMHAYKFPQYATPLNLGKKIAVIGGGNVALDCARAGLRLGKKVMLLYRRSEKEMPGRIEEIRHAREEGVIFKFLTQPVEIFGDKAGFVKAIGCIKMKLGKPDDSGRKRPVPVEKSNFIIDVDTVIVAIGQRPNPLLAKVTAELKTNPEGTILVDENFMTTLAGVFAGGDIATGADTVISAMGAGKKAAVAIDRYIHNDQLPNLNVK